MSTQSYVLLKLAKFLEITRPWSTAHFPFLNHGFRGHGLHDLHGIRDRGKISGFRGRILFPWTSKFCRDSPENNVNNML